jgi:hypothetical protein
MFRTMRVTLILFALMLSLATAKNTFAQTTFDFDWTGNYGPGIGVFTATPDGGGVYTITSISGTQDGLPLTLLSPGGYGGNDILLYSPGAPLLFDFPGVSFNDGTNSFNIYDNGGQYYECSSAVDTVCYGGDGSTFTKLSVTPTPEPRSFLLVLPAFVAFLYFAFRKGFR